MEVIAENRSVLSRRYHAESDLGNLFADVLRQATGAQVALMQSGALRKDLPAGPIRRLDLLDAFPFEDRLAVAQLTGAALKAVLEQGLSLQRGLLQVSGLQIEADLSHPVGHRLLAVTLDGQPLSDDSTVTVSTVEIVAKGGDLYTSFLDAKSIKLLDWTYADVLEDGIKALGDQGPIATPTRGRVLMESAP